MNVLVRCSTHGEFRNLAACPECYRHLQVQLAAAEQRYDRMVQLHTEEERLRWQAVTRAEQAEQALACLLDAIDCEGEAAHYDTVSSGCVTNARKVLNR